MFVLLVDQDVQGSYTIGDHVVCPLFSVPGSDLVRRASGGRTSDVQNGLTRTSASITIRELSEVPVGPSGKRSFRSQFHHGFHPRGYTMFKRSLTALVAAIAVAVLVQADEKEKTQPKIEPARASIVGNLVCSKCNFKATEKCQTALQLDEKQFVLVSGKAGENLFDARCTGKLVRVFGTLTVKDGVATIKSGRSTEVNNQFTFTG